MIGADKSDARYEGVQCDWERRCPKEWTVARSKFAVASVLRYVTQLGMASGK